MKRSLLAVGCLLAGTGIASAAMDGRWAISLESCTAEFADDILEVNLATGAFGYYESLCTITQRKDFGESGVAFAATFTCSGEGETWIRSAVVGLFESFDGTPDKLAMIDTTDGWTTVWQRCE